VGKRGHARARHSKETGQKSPVLLGLSQTAHFLVVLPMVFVSAHVPTDDLHRPTVDLHVPTPAAQRPTPAAQALFLGAHPPTLDLHRPTVICTGFS
jgi:hypothetical protein